MAEHDSAYRTTLSALRAELNEAQARVDKLRSAITSIEDLLARPKGPMSGTQAGQVELLADPRVSTAKSLVEAARFVLDEAGVPLRVTEIMQRIIAKGYPYSKGPGPMRNTLVPGLDRKVKLGETFTKPAPGIYGLQEWNVMKLRATG
jgi:hypothetical protein